MLKSRPCPNLICSLGLCLQAVRKIARKLSSYSISGRYVIPKNPAFQTGVLITMSQVWHEDSNNTCGWYKVKCYGVGSYIMHEENGNHFNCYEIKTGVPVCNITYRRVKPNTVAQNIVFVVFSVVIPHIKIINLIFLVFIPWFLMWVRTSLKMKLKMACSVFSRNMYQC